MSLANAGAAALEGRGSLAEIAAQLGVARQTVSRWRSGKKRPGTEARRKLHELFGIDPHAWDRRVELLPQGVEAPIPPEPASAQPASSTRSSDPLEVARRHLARAQRRRREAERSGSAKLIADRDTLERRAIETLAKVERDAAVTIDHILEHPEFKEAVKTLIDAITPWPAALYAVCCALSELDGHPPPEMPAMHPEPCPTCGHRPDGKERR